MPTAALTIAPVDWLPGYAFDAGTGVISIPLTAVQGLTVAEAEDDFRKLSLSLFQALRRKFQTSPDDAKVKRYNTTKTTFAESVTPVVVGPERLVRTLSIRISLLPGTEEVGAPEEPYGYGA